MKKLIILLICFFLCCSCATLKPHPRKWTKSEKVVAGYFVLGQLADVLTTEKMLDSPNIYETNFILGRHPSDSKIIIYFSIIGITLLTLSHFYSELRYPILSVFGTTGLGYAIHNKRLIDGSSP